MIYIMHILVIDVGGTHVKILNTGQMVHRQFSSGPTLTAKQMVARVKKVAGNWQYDAVSIGYPGQVLHNQPLTEPHNLAHGWVGFDYKHAFERPVRMINDAAMQAFGSYQGGKMLFLGFGTGLGSALVVDSVIVPMELAHLPFKKNTFEYYVGIHALERMGKTKWRRQVTDVIERLTAAFLPDETVLGGGNANNLGELPPSCRKGSNADAFTGGFRLWER